VESICEVLYENNPFGVRCRQRLKIGDNSNRLDWRSNRLRGIRSDTYWREMRESFICAYNNSSALIHCLAVLRSPKILISQRQRRKLSRFFCSSKRTLGIKISSAAGVAHNFSTAIPPIILLARSLPIATKSRAVCERAAIILQTRAELFRAWAPNSNLLLNLPRMGKFNRRSRKSRPTKGFRFVAWRLFPFLVLSIKQGNSSWSG
jgi:hypothetical protein